MALNPLAERLAELLRHRSVRHADETPVRQLDPSSGKTHRAYLWVFRSNALETDPPSVPGKEELALHRFEAGRQTARSIQNLLATATLNGIDPAAWLRDTLEKLPTCLNSEIDLLLTLRV